MISINNVQPLSAETVFDLLKKEFSAHINSVLGANLAIEYAHVQDVVNILLPEIAEGIAFTVLISEDNLEVIKHAEPTDYNLELIQEHLLEFLSEKAS